MKRALLIGTLLIVVAIIIMFGHDYGNTDLDDESAGDNAVQPEQSRALPEFDEVPSAAPATPDRTFLSTQAKAAIFADVSDSELDHEGLEEFISARPIGAYRIVHVDGDALRTLIRDSGQTGSFEVQLLDGDPMSLVSEYAEEHSSGWQSGFASWIGQVEGDETSRASFNVRPDGMVDGVVRTLATGRIKIEPIQDTQIHIIWQWAPDFKRNLD